MEIDSIDISIDEVVKKSKTNREVKFPPQNPSGPPPDVKEMSHAGIGRNILDIYSRYPELEELSMSRTKTSNDRRNQIWEKIVKEVNELLCTQMDVTQIKRNVEYWRNRFDSTPSTSEHLTVETIPSSDVCLTPPPSPKVFVLSMSDKLEWKGLMMELMGLRKDLRFKKLIKMGCAGLKATGMDEKYKKRDFSSNERRKAFWKTLANSLNQMFLGELKEMKSCQVRKCFSNYKARHKELFAKDSTATFNKNHKDIVELQKKIDKKLQQVQKFYKEEILKEKSNDDVEQMMH